MQQQNITIRLINLAGEVLGQLTLPASMRLTDLSTLRSLGVQKMEVLR